VLAAGFRTAADGTLTQIGTTDVVASSEDTAGWDADLDASSTNIIAVVTGAADTDISWRCELTIVPVGAGFNNI